MTLKTLFGKSEIIETKNINNLSSVNYILIPPSSRKSREDGHWSKPVREQRKNTKRPSLSQDKNNRIQGQDFLGNHLQFQVIPSDKFGDSQYK